MKRLLVGLVVVGALTGCGAAGQEVATRTDRSSHPQAAAATAAPAVHASPATPVDRPEKPDQLSMAGISSPVERLSLHGTTLTPPSDPTVLGWWGRPVGAARGVTLLVGHTVHAGGGDLDDLEDVAPGTVANVDGHRYTVRTNNVISKRALAERAPQLFSQTGKHRLVIVTCEDYDPTTGHYRSNVVLTATPRP